MLSSIPYPPNKTPGYDFITNFISSMASSTSSTISSLIEPINARFIPVCSLSNLGHSIPGVSKSSTFLLRLIHCLPFVTPGLFPVFALAFRHIELIKVDFPTFGIPTTMALTGLFIIPLFLSRSIFSLVTGLVMYPEACIRMASQA